MKRAFKYSLLMAGIFGAFVLVAFLVGNTPFTRVDTITINASEDEILSYLLEPRKATRWMTDLQDVSQLMKDESGDDYRNIYLPTDMFKQSVELHDASHVTFSYDDHYAMITDDYSFSAAGNPAPESDETDSQSATNVTTEVRRTIRYEYRGWHRIVAPFIRNAVNRRVSVELGQLRQAIDDENQLIADKAALMAEPLVDDDPETSPE